MTQTRSIKKVLKNKPVIEGAGVYLHRVFGFSETPLFDPFLLLDDFRSDDPEHYLKGFPWHPHRGIETITYVLNGDVEHGDSLGNKGVIGSGDVQWMTAGSGIIHQEMPKGDSNGKMYGFQLWANLPAKDKMMDPRYRGILKREIPQIELPGNIVVKIIAGDVAGVRGPVQDIVTNPEYLDVTLPAHSQFRHPTTRGHRVFAYVIGGKGFFCEEKKPLTYDIQGKSYFDMDLDPSIVNGSVVLFEDGDEITAITEEHSVRFLLVSGRPLGEPIAWYGPIVMNTRKELQVAFDEFNQGTFIKYKS
jgi:quercetin 2,3-dioxygenase